MCTERSQSPDSYVVVCNLILSTTSRVLSELQIKMEALANDEVRSNYRIITMYKSNDRHQCVRAFIRSEDFLVQQFLFQLYNAVDVASGSRRIPSFKQTLNRMEVYKTCLGNKSPF